MWVVETVDFILEILTFDVQYVYNDIKVYGMATCWPVVNEDEMACEQLKMGTLCDVDDLDKADFQL